MGTTKERIQEVISTHDIVLFMKGVPAAPQCGFSAAVVQILSSMGVPFSSVDVLQDPFIREGIKEFSQWPTVPQLYVKGEFVGGCDIVREMYDSGELRDLLHGKGIYTKTA
jgi:monothiol glutaredoxin